MASSRFRSRLTLGQTINRVDLRLMYLQRIPTIRRLQAGVVTAPKIARDAITGDNIVDGSITGEKIAQDSINASHIEAGSITAQEIQAGTITAENIATNTITADQINARSIGSEELAIGAVYAENIQAGAIRTEHILAGQIEGNQIKANARIDSPVIDGGRGTFKGTIRATRLIANDLIGVGPPDLEDPPQPDDSLNSQLNIADYIAIRPWVANPGVDLTSQVTLWQDGRIELTATTFEAMELNGYKFAARNHRHKNVVSHGQSHNSTEPSDIRLKKDIEPLNYGLDFIEDLRPVQFRMINGDGEVVVSEETMEPVHDEHGHEVTKFRDGRRIHFGLIAQDVQELVNHLGLDFSGHVIPDYENNPDGMQQLDYTQMIAPLIRAVQELAEQNRYLAGRITDLESKIQ